MTNDEVIELFFSQSYEKDVNKMLLDDINFIVPKENVCQYIRSVLAIPYGDLIDYIRHHPFQRPIQSRDITQCGSFAASEREMCQALLFIDNPGLQYVEIGRLFPKYVTSQTDVAFQKYGENQIKTSAQLGLTFAYYDSWYLSCVGYVYELLTAEERKSLLARNLLRDRLYGQIMVDICEHPIDILSYMDCIKSDSTKARRYGCVEYLVNLCISECERANVVIHKLLDTRIRLKKNSDKLDRAYINYVEPITFDVDLPINVLRRYSSNPLRSFEQFRQDVIPPYKDKQYWPSRSDYYIEQISKIPNLSAQEEKELFSMLENGDMRARDAIVESMLPLVVYLAKQKENSRVPLDDLIQEGSLGVMRAINGFDKKYGVRFVSYATLCIKSALNDAAYRYSFSAHIPQSHIIPKTKLRDAIDRLYQLYERQPEVEEIAEELNVPIENIEENLSYYKRVITIENIDIYDDNYINPDRGLVNEAFCVDLEMLLAKLKPREAELIRYLYGLGTAELTLDEIGENWGLTRTRVEQITDKAIRTLQSCAESRALRSYLGGCHAEDWCLTDIDLCFPYCIDSNTRHITTYDKLKQSHGYTKQIETLLIQNFNVQSNIDNTFYSKIEQLVTIKKSDYLQIWYSVLIETIWSNNDSEIPIEQLICSFLFTAFAYKCKYRAKPVKTDSIDKLLSKIQSELRITSDINKEVFGDLLRTNLNPKIYRDCISIVTSKIIYGFLEVCFPHLHLQKSIVHKSKNKNFLQQETPYMVYQGEVSTLLISHGWKKNIDKFYAIIIDKIDLSIIKLGERELKLSSRKYTIEIRQSPKDRRCQIWTKDEEDRLLTLFENSDNYNEIASQIGRTCGAITARLQKLGRIKWDKTKNEYVRI